MKYLPYEHFKLGTSLKPEEIKTILAKNIGDSNIVPKGWFYHNLSRMFSGKIKDNTFKLRRNIAYRNSFLPQISGVIEDNLNGSVITIDMKMSLFVIIFSIIWCSGVLLALTVITVVSIKNQSFNSASLIPLGMLAFFYALVMIAFKTESKRSQEDLKAILKAEIMN